MSDQRIHQSIQKDPENFKGFSKLVRNNKKYAIRAIRLDEENILHIGKNLDTTEFIKECISSNIRVLKTRPDLMSNKEIIKYCLSKFNPSVFINYFKLEALEDYEIAIYAVKFSGEYLMYMNSDFKSHRELVLESVKNFSFSLQYADQTLLDDLSFIFDCIKVSPFSIQYVPEHLPSDVNFLKKSIQLNWNVFQFINEKTEELIITSIHENIECIKFIPSSFFKNKKIIKLCLEKDGLTHMKEIANVTEDRDLVLKILKEDSLYFKEMPRKFKFDKEIILKSGKKNKIIYNFVPKIMIRNDVEIEWKSKGYWKLISEMDKNRDIHFNFSYCL
jgi:hypothetical protein